MTKDPYDNAPDSLPEVGSKEKKAGPIDRSRVCGTCGQEARIVSKMDGVRAFCGKCKTNWAVSGPRAVMLQPAPARGLSKQTVVEPDWDLADQFDDDESEYKRDG